MVEDLLTHDERLRLECLAQAVSSSYPVGQVGKTGDQIIARAQKFEAFVKGVSNG